MILAANIKPGDCPIGLVFIGCPIMLDTYVYALCAKINQSALHPRSTRAPLLGLSGTMGDHEMNLQAQKKHSKNNIIGGFWWSVIALVFGLAKRHKPNSPFQPGTTKVNFVVPRFPRPK